MPSPVARQAILLSGTAVKPVWQANFLTASSLPAGLTYTKSGSIPATLFDSTGKLTYQGNNLLTYSNTFSNAAWSPNNIVTPILQNATDPFGNANSAWTLTDNSTNGEHRIYNLVDSNSPPTSYVKSIYAKAGTASYIALSYGLNPQYAVFNVSTGAVSSAVGVTASITSVGNGWYLCSITPTTLIGQQYVVINMGDTAAHAVPGVSYVGSGSTVQIYRANYSYVTYETAPRSVDLALAPTTSAALFAPRLDTNPSTLAPRGLLVEEQRVQLTKYSGTLETTGGTWQSTQSGSANTITLNNTTSPDGTVDASQITYNTAVTGAGTYSLWRQNYTTSANGTYTFSVWLKAGTLTQTGIRIGDSAGNRGHLQVNLTSTWTRYTVTGTTTASISLVSFDIGVDGNTDGYTQATGTLYAWGAQLELGSFPTSYIPNATASTVTRTADVVSGANYNATQGSIIAEFAAYSPATAAQKVFSLSPVAQGKYLAAGTDGSAGWYNTGLQLSTGSANTPIRIGITYNSTGLFTAASNGASAYLASSASDYTGGATRFGLGDQTASGQFLNGWLRSIATYNVPMAKAPLQSRVVIGAPY